MIVVVVPATRVEAMAFISVVMCKAAVFAVPVEVRPVVVVSVLRVPLGVRKSIEDVLQSVGIGERTAGQ